MNDRMEVVQQIVRHISENVPILGLMYEARPTLLLEPLVNVDAATDTRNAHEWDVVSSDCGTGGASHGLSF